MNVGERWAYRGRPGALGAPVEQVEVTSAGIGTRAGTARVRFGDGPEAGRQEWVRKACLLVPWNEVEAFARDEEREAAVADASRDARGTVEFAAAQLVLAVLRPKGRLRLRTRIADAGVLEMSDLDLVASWLNLSPHQLRHDPAVFEDRNGRCLAAWPVTLQIARHTAALYADDVRREADRRAQDLARPRPAPAPWRQSREWQKQDFRESVLSLVRQWCATRRHYYR